MELLRSLKQARIVVDGRAALSCSGVHPGWIQLEPVADGKAASFPLHIDVEITRRCNLLCRHCLSAANRHGLPSELSTREILEVVDEADRYGAFLLKFCGAEPFLRKDLPDLLDAACQGRCVLSLLTNCTLITKADAVRLGRITALREQSFGLGTSLDGARPETHDWFRGRKGAFAQALRGMRLLSEQGVRLTIQTSLNQRNLEEMGAIAKIAASLNTELLVYLLPVRLGRGRKMGGSFLSSDQMLRAMRVAAEIANRYSGRFRVNFDPRHTPVQSKDEPAASPVPAGHTGKKHRRARALDVLSVAPPPCTCPAGVYMVAVAADGSAFPCGDCVGCHELSGGSVKNAPLHRIWRTDAWARLRGGWSWQDLAVCKTCADFGGCGPKICRGYPATALGDFYGPMPECLDADGQLTAVRRAVNTQDAAEEHPVA
ncbi:MAG: radical SAM protein [Armatimonadota bacterium]